MARGDLKFLGANVEPDYADHFWESAEMQGVTKTQIVKAMAQLWLDSPDSVRIAYLTQKTPRDSAFADAVAAIVYEVLATYGIYPPQVAEVLADDRDFVRDAVSSAEQGDAPTPPPESAKTSPKTPRRRRKSAR